MPGLELSEWLHEVVKDLKVFKGFKVFKVFLRGRKKETPCGRLLFVAITYSSAFAVPSA